MFRVWGRHEQNLIYCYPPALGLPGTARSPWVTKDETKPLTAEEETRSEPKQRQGLNERIMNSFLFPLLSMASLKFTEKGQTVCYERAIISKGKGWGQGDMDRETN